MKCERQDHKEADRMFKIMRKLGIGSRQQKICICTLDARTWKFVLLREMSLSFSTLNGNDIQRERERDKDRQDRLDLTLETTHSNQNLALLLSNQ
jgi:hypothetical protein